MKIHEYQAKSILARHGVAVPRGGVAATPEEAMEVARTLSGPLFVVKSQVHAGGRGKGCFKEHASAGALERALSGQPGVPGQGGVRLAHSPGQVGDFAETMLGSTLVTRQTGRDGVKVRTLYVEQGCDIARELYLAVLVDRARERVVVMASTEGGTEIEEVAATHP